MRCSLLARFAAIAALALAIPAAAAPADRPKTINKLPAIESFQLANGLQVAVLRSDAAPIVSVQLWYRAGSKDEPRDRRGSAHMFEHLLFKGTARVRPEMHAQAVNALGGYVNAATDEDSTHFVNTLPASYLDYAIELEADRMRNLFLRKAMIDAERDTVKGEIRQQDSSPLAVGLIRFLAVGYTAHPYAWTSSGNAKELDAITQDDLKKFYDAYYQPNNALLVVVGSAALADVKASAEKHFGAIAKSAEPPRPAAAAQEPAQTAARRQTVDPGPVGLSFVGWHIPAAKHKDVPALQLTAVLLGGGDTARLKQRLKTPDAKTKKSLAAEVGMDALIREHPGMAVAFAAYRDASEAAAAEAAILDEVAVLGARGPAADELRRAKNQMLASMVFSLENVQGLGEAIGRSWILTGDANAFVRDADALDRLTAGDIQRVIKQYLTPDHATIVVIPPKAR